jgi:hypothetical protein
MRIGSSKGSSNFAAGFIFALMLLAAVTVAVRAVKWLTTTELAAWWTTPLGVTPADILTGVPLVAAIVLLWLTIIFALDHDFRGDGG